MFDGMPWLLSLICANYVPGLLKYRKVNANSPSRPTEASDHPDNPGPGTEWTNLYPPTVPTNPGQEPTIQNSNYVNSNRSGRNIKALAQTWRLSLSSSCISQPAETRKPGKVHRMPHGVMGNGHRTTGNMLQQHFFPVTLHREGYSGFREVGIWCTLTLSYS